ncbi:MAG: hypothetical protein KGH91_03680 [Rhodospirillales bacterium]|nr:hypothetical protein [Rhodospirillales bacterium]
MQAASIAEDARRTFAAGGLDARAETDLVTLHTQLQTAKFPLAVLLGLGLPVHG